MSTKEQDYEISFCLVSAALQKWYQPDPVMKTKLEFLARGDQQEVSCAEGLTVLDRFAEAVDQGENVLLFMPLIKGHLDVCPACREKYEILLMTLQPGLE
jgi:hypothetical protein